MSKPKIIENGKRKGHSWAIHFDTEGIPATSCAGDRFVATVDTLYLSLEESYVKTITAARALIEKTIDEHVANIPSSDQGWVEEVEKCVMQDGYEDWHIDRCMVIELLKKAVQHFVLDAERTS